LPTGKPSPFSLEDPADTADSYACWTGENADEAAVGWTERMRKLRTFATALANGSHRSLAAVPGRSQYGRNAPIAFLVGRRIQGGGAIGKLDGKVN
jgi:hypothetical protein